MAVLAALLLFVVCIGSMLVAMHTRSWTHYVALSVFVVSGIVVLASTAYGFHVLFGGL